MRKKELASDDPRILFTGFVQGEVLEKLYSNVYVYVLPGDLEGMPLSLLEAMSFGNCCLTSDISECTQVTGSYGLSFQKGNVDDLKERLQALCNQEPTVRDDQENDNPIKKIVSLALRQPEGISSGGKFEKIAAERMCGNSP